MPKNVKLEDVSSSIHTAEYNVDYFDYSKAEKNTLNVNFFESEYITAKLSKTEVLFVRKNYFIPLITKGGRKLVKEISPRTNSHYEVYISESFWTSDGIKTRPKVIDYLLYKQGGGYEPMTPKGLIEYNLNYMKKNKLPVTKEVADKWQNELDTYLFLHR